MGHLVVWSVGWLMFDGLVGWLVSGWALEAVKTFWRREQVLSVPGFKPGTNGPLEWSIY